MAPSQSKVLRRTHLKKFQKQREKRDRRREEDAQEEWVWVENCWGDRVPRLPPARTARNIAAITAAPLPVKQRLVCEGYRRAYVIVHPQGPWPHLSPRWFVKEKLAEGGCGFYHVSLHSSSIEADQSAIDDLHKLMRFWLGAGDAAALPDLTNGTVWCSPQWRTYLGVGSVDSESRVAYIRRGGRSWNPVWQESLNLRQGYSCHSRPYVTMSM